MRKHLVKKPGLQASSIVASDAAMAVISREAALRVPLGNPMKCAAKSQTN